MFDRNGNIITVDRNGSNSFGSDLQVMDEFRYYYYTQSGSVIGYAGGMPLNGTNKLAYVEDNAGDGNYVDIDDQGGFMTPNYEYDGNGNLTKDPSEEIDKIEWYASGKIKKIEREGTSSKSDLEFIYDAGGNRIIKIVKPRDGTGVLSELHWSYTYYVRDASGNVMAVYKRDLNASGSDITDNMTLTEQHLYGSSRVGLKRPKNDNGSEVVIGGFTFTPGSVNGEGIFPVNTILSSTTASDQPKGYRWMTRKSYELSNHLGNVYSVITDKKIGVASTEYLTSVAYYTADVISATDYYAFGASMPQRTFQSDDYRYGFNGKENDSETGTQDYGFRIYNPALGKFLSVDPLRWEYPELTPYQFASNTPIQAVDIDGLEAGYVQWGGTFSLPFFEYVGVSGAVQIGVALDIQGNLAVFSTFGGGIGVGAGLTYGLSFGGYPWAESYQDMIGTGAAAGAFVPGGRSVEGSVSLIGGGDYRIGGTYGPSRGGVSHGVAGYGMVTTTKLLASFDINSADGEIQAIAYLVSEFGISQSIATTMITLAREQLAVAQDIKAEQEKIQNTVITGDVTNGQSDGNSAGDGQNNSPNSKDVNNQPPQEQKREQQQEQRREERQEQQQRGQDRREQHRQEQRERHRNGG